MIRFRNLNFPLTFLWISYKIQTFYAKFWKFNLSSKSSIQNHKTFTNVLLFLLDYSRGHTKRWNWSSKTLSRIHCCRWFVLWFRRCLSRTLYFWFWHVWFSQFKRPRRFWLASGKIILFRYFYMLLNLTFFKTIFGFVFFPNTFWCILNFYNTFSERIENTYESILRLLMVVVSDLFRGFGYTRFRRFY